MPALVIQLVIFRCRTCELQNMREPLAPDQTDFESFTDALAHVMDRENHVVVAIVAPE